MTLYQTTFLLSALRMGDAYSDSIHMKMQRPRHVQSDIEKLFRNLSHLLLPKPEICSAHVRSIEQKNTETREMKHSFFNSSL